MGNLPIVLSTINGFSSVAGTVGNVLVCFVIYRNEELQTGVNFFILSLSVADLTVCSVAQPLYIYYLNQEWSPESFRNFKIVSYVALHASFLNLLSLTINRLFAVWRSLEYATVMGGKNIARFVCFGWVLSVVMAIVFSTTSLKKPAPYFHLAMLLMFLLMYTKIFTIARKQRRQIASQFQAVSHNYRVKKFTHDHLPTRTLAILISVSVVLFMPDLVFQLKGSSDYTRFRWSFTTMFLSSFFNPCVYVWRCEKFRLALYKTFGFSRGGSDKNFSWIKGMSDRKKVFGVNNSRVGIVTDSSVRVINIETLNNETVLPNYTLNVLKV